MSLKQSTLAKLPKIDRLVADPVFSDLLSTHPRTLVLDLIREELDIFRQDIIAGYTPGDFDSTRLIERIHEHVERRVKPALTRCINAAGIILHTGLGRAPLSEAAQHALMEVSENFSTLEIDIDSGTRGDRHRLVENLLIRLTGAEAAAVVNNNAAATLLALNTLAFGREVIVSRGELITIGGAFRIPDIMKKSGAKMVEVGTTNQTWYQDYQEAIHGDTALLLKVHTSNYRLKGFVADVSLADLVKLGHQRQLPVIHDLGSGSLIDLSRYGLPKEPVVGESIAAGADLVMFSGDKLLGGPQSGIIVGRKHYVEMIRKNQLARALRCGKLTFAALEATLRLFMNEEKLSETHPVIRLLTTPLADIAKRARTLSRKLKPYIENQGKVGIEKGNTEIGGGSLATETLSTFLIRIRLHSMNEKDLAKRLRFSDPPIISRISNDSVVLDMRTVRNDELNMIVNAFKKILS